MFLKCVFFLLTFPFFHCAKIQIVPSLPITIQNSENIFCSTQSKQYLSALENFTLWAYEMRDASAQSATSVLRGSGFNMGNLEQCLTANAPFPTQYCLTVINANIPKPKINRDPYSLVYNPNENVINKLYDYKDVTKAPRNIVRMGWCIPKACSSKDAEKSLNKYLQESNIPLKEENVSFTASVPAILCQSSDNRPKMDSVDISFCVLTVVLIIFVLFATIRDYNSYKNDTLTSKVVQAFSAIQSVNELVKPDKSEKPLKILYGLKTFSLLMIIGGHRFALFAGSPMITYDFIEQHYRNTLTSALYHGDLFVDTFFFISGLLVTYIGLGHLDNNTFKPGYIILGRYLRLTPAYAFVIFFQATLLYHSGTGALWEPIIGQEREDCRNNWWTGILYISNTINSEHQCMIQTWYLPCDFHYFLLALIIIYLLKKNTVFGMLGISLCSLITMGITFYITYVNERPAFLRFLLNFLANPKVFIDFQLTYIQTYTRGLPYFAGIYAGYMYYKFKGTDFMLTKIHSVIILLISSTSLSLLMLSSAIFYNPYHEYNILESSFYASTFRLIWALGTLGFTYSVSFGPPGILYKFLSGKLFIPLSRLTYGAFLCHFGFQIRDIAATVNPRKYVIFDVYLDWISDTVWAFMLAFVLYLLVEEPFRRILRIFFEKKLTNLKQNLLKEIDNKLESSKV